MGLTGAVIAAFSYRKHLEQHWVTMGRGSGPREQLKAFPALVPIQTLEKTPCLPCSWSLRGTPGTVLDVRAGGDNDHSHSEHPAKDQHPQKPRHLVIPQPSRRHVLGDTVLRGREKQTKGYQLRLSGTVSFTALWPLWELVAHPAGQIHLGTLNTAQSMLVGVWELGVAWSAILMPEGALLGGRAACRLTSSHTL